MKGVQPDTPSSNVSSGVFLFEEAVVEQSPEKNPAGYCLLFRSLDFCFTNEHTVITASGNLPPYDTGQKKTKNKNQLVKIWKSWYTISQGSADRTAHEQEHVGAIQEGTAKCRAALLELVHGFLFGGDH